MFSLKSLSLLLLLTPSALCQSYTGPEDPRIRTEITYPHPINGVSTTANNSRIFLVIARVDGSKGPSVVEWNATANSSTAYPNKEWNSYSEGKDPATHFVGINSQRIGPDGKLYVVDKGAPSFGSPALLPYGPKIVRVDLESNEVDRIFYLGNATYSTSFVDDIRFNPAKNKAYITDAGDPPALIVLDTETGGVVRVLNNDPSTKGISPPYAEGTYLYFDGKPFHIYADQLEVSPDGCYFYYQPCEGAMSRISTDVLDMAFYNSSLAASPDVLAQYVEPFALTPSTGGTAIAANGDMYVSDTARNAIVRLMPNGTIVPFIEDPRLVWVDAMWIDSNERLWMPAAQLNRGEPFNNGTDRIVFPLHVYSINIGVGPSAIDHA